MSSNNSSRSSSSAPRGRKPRGQGVPSLSQVVAAKYANGEVSCGRACHFKYGPPAQQGALSRPVVALDHRDVLSLMMPGDTAKCPCEMRACERSWNDPYFLRDGVFASRWVERGSYTMGVLDKTCYSRRVYKTKYSLSPTQLGVLHKRFPTLWFATGDENHDHPVAHISTDIASTRLVNAACQPRANKADGVAVYVDLHGNPQRNHAFNRDHRDVRIETVVQEIDPTDSVRRYFKWGDATRFTESSLREMGKCISPEWEAKYDKGIDGFLSIHTLYYADMEEICAMVNAAKKPLFAIMHRFVGESGKLNNGEQEWVKRSVAGRTHIEQRNLTGLPYSHPDNSIWFDQNSWSPPPCTTGDRMIHYDGISWDINMACDETYTFRIVPCPGKTVANGFQHQEFTPDSHRKAVSNYEVKLTSRYTLSCDDSEVELIVDAPKTFKAARTLIAGKPRTADKWADHLAATKRMLKANEEESASVNDIALASFFADFSDDAKKLGTVFRANGAATRSHARTLKGAEVMDPRNLVRDFLSSANIILAVAGASPAKAAQGIITHAIDALDNKT